MIRNQIALASWTEVEREGDFVKMRRGPEVGWWHDHKDGNDFGGNPCWWEGKIVWCSNCKVQKPSN